MNEQVTHDYNMHFSFHCVFKGVQLVLIVPLLPVIFTYL